MSSAVLEAVPPTFEAVQEYFPASSGNVSGIMSLTRPSLYEISKSGESVTFFPSLYHFMVGSGLPIIK